MPNSNASNGAPDVRLVGIGASAGGLQALQGFLDALPSNTGLAFVVVVHLDPSRKSELAGLLQSHTPLRVSQVSSRVQIEPECVYVIPPAKRILVADGHLMLRDFDEPRGQRAPIDQFFRSLAECHGNGFAILLSGGGSDGVIGLRSIKGAGGVVLVQAPEEADVDSMPRSAIDAGVVDVVLPVAELARRLVELAKAPAYEGGISEQLEDGEGQPLQRILAHLRARTGHDFSRYKRTTLLRRVARRMQVNAKESLAAYYQFQRENGEESRALFHDLLIGVTTFFREPAAFDTLEKLVAPQLFAGKGPEDVVRVWTPGCATGEEAYSLAMILLDYARELDGAPRLQLFASDLDERALATARGGRYPKAIEVDVPEERLKRYFFEADDHYEVVKELRETTLFAAHNLTRDPPFSRIDLISCRNLLIYLERDLQERIFEILRYALVPGGCLFLGSAETPTGADGGGFETLSKKHRLFRIRKQLGDPATLPDLQAMGRSARSADRVEEPLRGTSGGALHQRILENYGPPSVLVDQANNAVNLSERVGHYLVPPGGAPTYDMTRLVRPELRQVLRSALHRAFEENESSFCRPVQVQFNGSARGVQLLVAPAQGEHRAQQLALVVFLEQPATAAADATVSRTATEEGRRLESELRRLQDELQAVREGAEVSNEELKAANEELQSINEEYRSTTEELETSKEELQSINEELQTVNHELKANLEKSNRINADLENFVSAVDIATLFLDADLQIKRFTPGLETLFSVRPADIGRPIGELKRYLDYDAFDADTRRALGGEQIEREVPATELIRWYAVRLRPYRDSNKRIDGVVLTFVDISALKRAVDEERDAKDYANLIIDTVRDPLLILDEDLHVRAGNRAFFETFRVDASQTVGRSLFSLGEGHWNISELRERLEGVVEADEAFDAFRVFHNFPDIGAKTLLLNARRSRRGGLILLAIEDISEQEAAQSALALSEKRLGLALDAAKLITCDWNRTTGELVFAGDFEGLFGVPAPSTIEEALDFLRPEDRLESRDALWEALRGGARGHEFQIVAGDDRTYWIEGWGVRISDREGERFVGIALDVTARKHSELDLRQLNATLERRVFDRTLQVRNLGSRLTMAEHQERNRIAQILHDDLQQLLYSIQLKVISVRTSSEAGDRENALQDSGEAEEWLKRAVRITQELAVDLSPQVLENEGLAEALGWLAAQMKELNGLVVEIKADERFRMSKPTRVLLFQIVRELLFNVVKHTGVKRAIVELRRQQEHLELRVEDFGRGFEAGGDHEGFGVTSVRHRLELLGGRLEIVSRRGNGTAVWIHVPLEVLER